jgi:hypothetical protein
MNHTSSNLIDVSSRKTRKRVLKRPYQIAGKIIVVLDDYIINKLSIDEETTWLEEIATKNGIFLKITNIATEDCQVK